MSGLKNPLKKEYDVTLTKEQTARIEEELFESYRPLDEKYLSEDTARYVLEIAYMYMNVMDEVVGKEGEKLSVEEALNTMQIGDVCNSVVEGEDYYYVLMRTEVDVDAYPYYGVLAETERDRWGHYTIRVLYRDDIFEQIFRDWADYADADCCDVLIDIFDIKNEL